MVKQIAASRFAAPLVAKLIPSPLGNMLAVADEVGIVGLQFSSDGDVEHVHRGRSISLEAESRHLSVLTAELKEYFAGDRLEFSVPVRLVGSPFAQRAWEYLKTIPFGQTRSYGQQARAISSANACRAVGRANGANPIAILIPCHRVIGANGSLTGYASGVDRKQWLLEHERAVVFSHFNKQSIRAPRQLHECDASNQPFPLYCSDGIDASGWMPQELFARQ